MATTENQLDGVRSAATPETAPARSGRTRIGWVDRARGVGILLVVFGHALRGLHQRGLVEEGLFTALDTRIYAFHMPLFFLLSGLFFLGPLARQPTSTFLKGRVIRLLYPMVLWTYIFLAAKALAGPLANDPVAPPDLLVSPFPGQLHLWFLWALFLIQVGMIAAKPMAGRIPDTALAGGVLALSLGLLTFHWPPPVLYWAGEAIANLPFFAAGLLLGSLFDRVRFPPFWLSMPAFAVLILGAPAILGLGLWPSLSIALALSLLVIAMAARLPDSGATTALARIGQASLAIYVAHTLFSAGIREGLIAAGMTDTGLHLLLGTTAGVAGPLLLLAAARRLGMVRILGL